MKHQESEGIIEEVNCEGHGKIFYLPHKPVIRENAESTKIRYTVSFLFEIQFNLTNSVVMNFVMGKSSR